jgi:hypothetical protein
LPSTLTVLNTADSGPGSLRDTIAAAKNGDTIVFDPSLAGQVINLTSGELVINESLDIEGLGGNNLPVTVSGNSSSRAFDITNPSSTVTLANLIIAGSATQGGGIFDAGATVNLAQDNVSGFAQGVAGALGSPGGDALGGAVYQAGGTLSIAQCVFFGGALGGAGGTGAAGGNALGGAIYEASGTLLVTRSIFEGGNLAFGGTGGDGAPGGNALGGNIYNAGGVLAADRCFFLGGGGSGVQGGTGGLGGGAGGDAAGGAIYDAAGTTTTVSQSVFESNFLNGGVGFVPGSGGTIRLDGSSFGGSIYQAGGSLTITNTQLVEDSLGQVGPGESNVSAGGAVYVAGGNVSMANTTIAGCEVGGVSSSLGGGVYQAGGSLTVTNCTFEVDSASLGGAIYQAAGSLTVTNSTFANNGAFSFGLAEGGALYIAGTATVQNCAFDYDSAIGAEGFGGAIFVAPDGTLTISNNTSFVGDTATTAGNNVYFGP